MPTIAYINRSGKFKYQANITDLLKEALGVNKLGVAFDYRHRLDEAHT